MADLFLSYKSEDRARVAPLAEALQADGLSVWWDADLAGGSEWRQSIQEQLDAARCVLVVWSKRSVGPEGRFVRDEATRAQRRGVYLPVGIDAVEPPLGFGETQLLSLIGWKGDRADPRYRALLAAVRTLAGGTSMPVHAAPAAAERRVGRRLLLAGGAALVVAAGAGGGWYWYSRDVPLAAGNSIAVLPFANLSGDPAQAYFSDGIAEELRAALSRIAKLKVAARTSSEMFRDASDIKRAAHELGVSNILLGSVRRSPGTVRVSAQLVDGTSGLERWSDSFDRPAGDVLAIQASVAESVAGALRIQLGGAEQAALRLGGTSSAAAHDAYLRAAALTATDEVTLQSALAAYDAAIAADPGYAAAYAGRAATLVNLANGWAKPEGIAPLMTAAQRATDRAIELEPNLPSAYSTLAFLKQSQLDFKGADKAFRKALALPGVDAATLNSFADFLFRSGHNAEGMTTIDHVMKLDALNTRAARIKAVMLMYARRFTEAETLGRRTPGAETIVGDALVLAGQPGAALVEYAKAKDDWRRLLGPVYAYARLGDRLSGDRALKALEAIDDGTFNYQLAQVHAQRGERELAMAALDRAWKGRDPGLNSVPADPFLDPLRSDPRFKALLVKLDFP